MVDPPSTTTKPEEVVAVNDPIFPECFELAAADEEEFAAEEEVADEEEGAIDRDPPTGCPDSFVAAEEEEDDDDDDDDAGFPDNAEVWSAELEGSVSSLFCSARLSTKIFKSSGVRSS